MIRQRRRRRIEDEAIGIGGVLAAPIATLELGDLVRAFEVSPRSYLIALAEDLAIPTYSKSRKDLTVDIMLALEGYADEGACVTDHTRDAIVKVAAYLGVEIGDKDAIALCHDIRAHARLDPNIPCDAHLTRELKYAAKAAGLRGYGRATKRRLCDALGTPIAAPETLTPIERCAQMRRDELIARADAAGVKARGRNRREICEALERGATCDDQSRGSILNRAKELGIRVYRKTSRQLCEEIAARDATTDWYAEGIGSGSGGGIGDIVVGNETPEECAQLTRREVERRARAKGIKVSGRNRRELCDRIPFGAQCDDRPRADIVAQAKDLAIAIDHKSSERLCAEIDERRGGAGPQPTMRSPMRRRGGGGGGAAFGKITFDDFFTALQCDEADRDELEARAASYGIPTAGRDNREVCVAIAERQYRESYMDDMRMQQCTTPSVDVIRAAARAYAIPDADTSSPRALCRAILDAADAASTPLENLSPDVLKHVAESVGVVYGEDTSRVIADVRAKRDEIVVAANVFLDAERDERGDRYAPSERPDARTFDDYYYGVLDCDSTSKEELIAEAQQLGIAAAADLSKHELCYIVAQALFEGHRNYRGQLQRCEKPPLPLIRAAATSYGVAAVHEKGARELCREMQALDTYPSNLPIEAIRELDTAQLAHYAATFGIDAPATKSRDDLIRDTIAAHETLRVESERIDDEEHDARKSRYLTSEQVRVVGWTYGDFYEALRCKAETMASLQARAARSGITTEGKSKRALCKEIALHAKVEFQISQWYRRECYYHIRDEPLLRSAGLAYGIAAYDTLPVAQLCGALHDASSADITARQLNRLNLSQLQFIALTLRIKDARAISDMPTLVDRIIRARKGRRERAEKSAREEAATYEAMRAMRVSSSLGGSRGRARRIAPLTAQDYVEDVYTYDRVRLRAAAASYGIDASSMGIDDLRLTVAEEMYRDHVGRTRTLGRCAAGSRPDVVALAEGLGVPDIASKSIAQLCREVIDRMPRRHRELQSLDRQGLIALATRFGAPNPTTMRDGDLIKYIQTNERDMVEEIQRDVDTAAQDVHVPGAPREEEVAERTRWSRRRPSYPRDVDRVFGAAQCAALTDDELTQYADAYGVPATDRPSGLSGEADRAALCESIRRAMYARDMREYIDLARCNSKGPTEIREIARMLGVDGADTARPYDLCGDIIQMLPTDDARRRSLLLTSRANLRAEATALHLTTSDSSSRAELIAAILEAERTMGSAAADVVAEAVAREASEAREEAREEARQASSPPSPPSSPPSGVPAPSSSWRDYEPQALWRAAVERGLAPRRGESAQRLHDRLLASGALGGIPVKRATVGQRVRSSAMTAEELEEFSNWTPEQLWRVADDRGIASYRMSARDTFLALKSMDALRAIPSMYGAASSPMRGRRVLREDAYSYQDMMRAAVDAGVYNFGMTRVQLYDILRSTGNLPAPKRKPPRRLLVAGPPPPRLGMCTGCGGEMPYTHLSNCPIGCRTPPAMSDEEEPELIYAEDYEPGATEWQFNELRSMMDSANLPAIGSRNHMYRALVRIGDITPNYDIIKIVRRGEVPPDIEDYTYPQLVAIAKRVGVIPKARGSKVELFQTLRDGGHMPIVMAPLDRRMCQRCGMRAIAAHVRICTECADVSPKLKGRSQSPPTRSYDAETQQPERQWTDSAVDDAAVAESIDRAIEDAVVAPEAAQELIAALDASVADRMESASAGDEAILPASVAMEDVPLAVEAVIASERIAAAPRVIAMAERRGLVSRGEASAIRSSGALSQASLAPLARPLTRTTIADAMARRQESPAERARREALE
jgi:hypothetical protein